MKCPCEKCICFAICNVRLKEMISPEICQLSQQVECDALKDYINLRSRMHKNYIRIDYTRGLFNLEPVNKGQYEGTTL